MAWDGDELTELKDKVRGRFGEKILEDAQNRADFVSAPAYSKGGSRAREAAFEIALKRELRRLLQAH
jgi:hypothetical protein